MKRRNALAAAAGAAQWPAPWRSPGTDAPVAHQAGRRARRQGDGAGPRDDRGRGRHRHGRISSRWRTTRAQRWRSPSPPRDSSPGCTACISTRSASASRPAFTAAGGHFDPGPAGNTDPDANHPYHLGDIPNLRVGADGSGTLHARTTRVTLSEGPLSLLDADGSAIIIHAKPGPGNHRRAEIRRERRTSGRVRRDREEVIRRRRGA